MREGNQCDQGVSKAAHVVQLGDVEATWELRSGEHLQDFKEKVLYVGKKWMRKGLKRSKRTQNKLLW